MSKKDYELIAEVVKGLDLSRTARREVAAAFSQELQKENTSFNEYRFLKACGVFDSLGEPYKGR